MRPLCQTMDGMTAQRTLIVMRHAEAGELPGGPDVERALRPSGRRDASQAGRWLAARGMVPDLVLCSSARRARQTWQYVSAELASAPEVVNDPRLYDAGARGVLEVIGEGAARAGGQGRAVMYVGHNPAAADATGILVGHPVELRTAAIAIVAIGVDWPDLMAGGGDGAGEVIATWAPSGEP